MNESIPLVYFQPAHYCCIKILLLRVSLYPTNLLKVFIILESFPRDILGISYV